MDCNFKDKRYIIATIRKVIKIKSVEENKEFPIKIIDEEPNNISYVEIDKNVYYVLKPHDVTI